MGITLHVLKLFHNCMNFSFLVYIGFERNNQGEMLVNLIEKIRQMKLI